MFGLEVRLGGGVFGLEGRVWLRGASMEGVFGLEVRLGGGVWLGGGACLA